MALFDDIQKLGIQYDHHESDLYIPITVETVNLVKEYDLYNIVARFKSNIDGKMWFDLPFQYAPYWEKRGMKDVMFGGDISCRTTFEYWDCECEHNYIRHKSEKSCLLCGAQEEDMPDSRVREVILNGFPLTDEQIQDSEL